MSHRLLTADVGDLNTSALPNDTAVAIGGAGAAGVARGSGNLWMQTPAPAVSPASTGGDIVIAVATIPAGAFDAANRCVTITANGNYAANANTKTVKIIANPTTANIGSAVVGGTTIQTSGAVTTNGAIFELGVDIVKTGVAGSNTQSAISQLGASLCQSLTLNEAATITIAVTANCATAVGDVTLWNFQGEWFN